MKMIEVIVLIVISLVDLGVIGQEDTKTVGKNEVINIGNLLFN